MCVQWLERCNCIEGYFRKLDKEGGGGGQTAHKRNLGGNMKTSLAVYEEGLFDLRGAKRFKGGGKCPLSPTPCKGTLVYPPKCTTACGTLVYTCSLGIYMT